jgi:hypothetical protein
MYYIGHKMIDITASGIGFRWRIYERHAMYPSGKQSRRLLRQGWAFTEAGARRRAVRVATWRDEWQREKERRLRTRQSQE